MRCVPTRVRHATRTARNVCTFSPAVSLFADAVHLPVTLETMMTTNALVRDRTTDVRARYPAIGKWLERIQALPGWRGPYECLPGERIAPRRR